MSDLNINVLEFLKDEFVKGSAGIVKLGDEQYLLDKRDGSLANIKSFKYHEPVYIHSAHSVSTLGSFVVALKTPAILELIKTQEAVIMVQGVDQVILKINFDDDMKSSKTLLVCSENFDTIQSYNRMDQERMIVTLATKFEKSDGRSKLLSVIGNIKVEESVQTADDGISMSATMKKGMQVVSGQKIDPIVTLNPYVTFSEIDQPEVKYLFRMKTEDKTVTCGLEPVVNTAWQVDCKIRIGEYIKSMAKKVGVDNLPIILV